MTQFCISKMTFGQTWRNSMFLRQNRTFWRENPLFFQSSCYASINLLAGYERSCLVLWTLTHFCVSNNKIWHHPWHISGVFFFYMTLLERGGADSTTFFCRLTKVRPGSGFAAKKGSNSWQNKTCMETSHNNTSFLSCTLSKISPPLPLIQIRAFWS